MSHPQADQAQDGDTEQDAQGHRRGYGESISDQSHVIDTEQDSQGQRRIQRSPRDRKAHAFVGQMRRG